MGGSGERVDPVEFYRHYNQACNAHEFVALDRFVDDAVIVNGQPQGLADYVAGLRAVVAQFPDFQWKIHHLVVDQEWIAVHFRDELGSRRDGSAPPATRQEFAFYRIADGKIVEVWVGTDSY